MKDRCCYNDNCKDFKNYGGRGITVCDKWLNDKWEFVAWAYEKGWERGRSLNRIDNNGPYAPWNCNWQDARSQARNRRSNTVLSAFGETKTLVEWSEDSRCRVAYNSLLHRIRMGWSHSDAISLDPKRGSPRGYKRKSRARSHSGFGFSRTCEEWSNTFPLSLSPKLISRRIKNGWTVEDAVSLPSVVGNNQSLRNDV